MQLAAKGQVRHAASQRSACFSLFLTGFQFNDLPPEVRPYKPDQGLKAELKASSAKGFDMAIGQVGVWGYLHALLLQRRLLSVVLGAARCTGLLLFPRDC